METRTIKTVWLISDILKIGIFCFTIFYMFTPLLPKENFLRVLLCCIFSIAFLFGLEKEVCKGKSKYYKAGEKRIVERFLVFPLSIKGKIRWFRKVKIEQEWIILPSIALEAGGGDCWSNLKFND